MLKKLLLHVCCAPCATYVSSERLAPRYDITWYFNNPNLVSLEEYDRRLDMVRLMADKFGFGLMVEPYQHADWLEMTRGREHDPERGLRCQFCYYSRLQDTAKLAKKEDFNLFGTSLLSSPYKDTRAIRNMSRLLAKKYDLDFLDEDFQADDGYRRSQNLARELGLYRQKFCGCEYSLAPNFGKSSISNAKKSIFVV